MCLFLLQDQLLFENRARFCFPLYPRNQHCQPHRRCLRSVSVNEWIYTCSGRQNPISLSFWCCVLASQENICAMLVIVFLLLPTCPPLSISPRWVGDKCLALITAWDISGRRWHCCHSLHDGRRGRGPETGDVLSVLRDMGKAWHSEWVFWREEALSKFPCLTSDLWHILCTHLVHMTGTSNVKRSKITHFILPE